MEASLRVHRSGKSVQTSLQSKKIGGRSDFTAHQSSDVVADVRGSVREIYAMGKRSVAAFVPGRHRRVAEELLRGPLTCLLALLPPAAETASSRT